MLILDQISEASLINAEGEVAKDVRFELAGVFLTVAKLFASAAGNFLVVLNVAVILQFQEGMMCLFQVLK